MVDINHFQVSLAHAHSSMLKTTALNHGIQLVEELAPCSGWSMVKRTRAPTPHHTMSQAVAPMDMVHIDTTGQPQKSLRGLQYIVMFEDSASRSQRPYGIQDKSASAILGVVKCYGGCPPSWNNSSVNKHAQSHKLNEGVFDRYHPESSGCKRPTRSQLHLYWYLLTSPSGIRLLFSTSTALRYLFKVIAV